MPYDGAGNYTPPAAPVFPAVTKTKISASKFNATILDIAQALTGAVTRDGQSALSGDLPFNGYNVSGARPATTSGEFVVFEQISGLIGAIEVVENDGSTDNTADVVAAAATGKPLYFKGGKSFCTTPTTISAPILNGPEHIFDIAAQVTISNGKPVYPDWFGDVEGAVLAAINSLPAAGGTVLFLPKVYKPSVCGTATGLITKNSVTLQGAGTPGWNTNWTALTGGTVIQGKLVFSGKGITVRDLGFDCGSAVISSYYPALDVTTDSMPAGGTWGGLHFTSSSSDCHVEHCTALLKKGAQGSGFYLQGLTNTLQNCTATYGKWPFRFGASQAYGDNLWAYAADEAGFYCNNGSTALGHVVARKTKSGTSPAESAADGAALAVSFGGGGYLSCNYLMASTGAGTVLDLNSGAGTGTAAFNFVTSDQCGIGVDWDSASVQKPIINKMILMAGTTGIKLTSAETTGSDASTLFAGSLELTNFTTGLQLLNNATLHTEFLEMVGCTTEWSVADTSRTFVGTSGRNLRASSQLRGLCTINAGTTGQYGVWLESYGITISISGDPHFSEVGALITTPAWLRPVSTKYSGVGAFSWSTPAPSSGTDTLLWWLTSSGQLQHSSPSMFPYPTAVNGYAALNFPL